MSLRVFNVLKEALRRPSYRQYLWARLRRIVAPEVIDPWARLHLSADTKLPERHCLVRDSALRKVRDTLFYESPYAGFNAETQPEDLQGWGSDDPVLGDAIRLLRPLRICEVGSWKGRSAVFMARAVQALGLDTEIVCVDTWLGSPEHWLEPEWYPGLRVRNGYPRLYETFLGNIIKQGLTDVVTPFPATSENAAAVFSKLAVRFDLIYVDAAHEYEPAKRDIAKYYELLQDDGLLVADDYGNWPGVTKAVDDFVAESRLHCIAKPGKAIIPKGQRYSRIFLR
jgi:hypothetical protein